MKRVTFLITSLIALSGCDVAKGLVDNFKSYSEPEVGNTARIRFVTTADDVRLYTNTTCASVKTDAGSVFYHLYPNTHRSSRSIGMPIVGNVPEPYVEYDVLAGAPIVVNFHKRYSMGSAQLVCNLLVTFTPEIGKDYQLQLMSEQPPKGFFTPNKNICYLVANEIVKTKKGYQLTPISVRLTDFCRRHNLSLFKGD